MTMFHRLLHRCYSANRFPFDFYLFQNRLLSPLGTFLRNAVFICSWNLKTRGRKFSSGLFNCVYSCLGFLFPVVLSTLPASLPFLLFLRHHCPPSSQKETLSVWQRQHPVCHWSPKNFLGRSGAHLMERENGQGGPRWGGGGVAVWFSIV